MTPMRHVLAAGLALGAFGIQAAAAATFTALPTLSAGISPTAFNYATFNDPVGVIYAAGTVASYPSAAAGSVTITSNLDVLERNDQSSYLDNNFSANASFINQCGFTGLFGCNPAGAVTIQFSVPTVEFAVSADDFDTTTPYTFTARAFNGTTLLGTVTASSLADNGASPALLAALSFIPITSVVITDPTGNFALSQVGAVPEPASLVLLCTGFAAMAAARRCKAG